MRDWSRHPTMARREQIPVRRFLLVLCLVVQLVFVMKCAHDNITHTYNETNTCLQWTAPCNSSPWVMVALVLIMPLHCLLFSPSSRPYPFACTVHSLDLFILDESFCMWLPTRNRGGKYGSFYWIYLKLVHQIIDLQIPIIDLQVHSPPCYPLYVANTVYNAGFDQDLHVTARNLVQLESISPQAFEGIQVLSSSSFMEPASTFSLGGRHSHLI